MMQNKTENFESSIDGFDDYIQSLSINQLKEFEKSGNKLTNKTVVDKEENNENFDIEIDIYIQTLQLSEIREIEKNSQLLKNIDKQAIKHKSKITGLDEKIIILIETRKEKATLEQLLIYCNKLHIPFQKIAPEFFMPIV